MATNNIKIVIGAVDTATAVFKRVQRRLKKFSAGISRIGAGMARFGRRALIALGAIGAGFVAAMVKAQEFNKQIGQIATLTSMSIREISKEVRALSAEFGFAKEELTKGLYDALSAGIPKDNVFEFMKVASKAAKAGAAGVSVAVEATTRIIDAYGLSAGNAEEINNKLFKTVKKGVITYDQLAGNIGKVAGVAQKAGISLDDLLAVIATSSKTVNAEQLFTGIRAGILSLAKTAQGGQMMIEKGLGGAFDEVANATGNTLVGLRQVITEARALPVALAVSGANASKYADNLDEVTDSTGAMQEAFTKMEETNPLDRLWQSLNNVVLTAGDAALQALAPTIVRAAEAAQRFSERIAEWFNSKKINELRGDIEGIVNALQKGGDDRSGMAKKITNVITSAFTVAAQNVISVLMRAAPTIGKLIGVAAMSAYKSLTGASQDAKFRAAQQLEKEGTIEKQGIDVALGLKPAVGYSKEWRKEREKLINIRAMEIEQADTLKKFGLDNLNNIKGQTEAEKRLALALKDLSATAKENLFTGPMQQKIEVDVNAKLNKASFKSIGQLLKVGPTPQEKIDEARKLGAQLEEDINKLKKKEVAERQSAMDHFKKAKSIAATSMTDWLKQKQSARENLDDEQKEEKKTRRGIERAREKQERGIKLSRRDAEMLADADRKALQINNQVKAQNRDKKAADKIAKEIKQKEKIKLTLFRSIDKNTAMIAEQNERLGREGGGL